MNGYMVYEQAQITQSGQDFISSNILVNRIKYKLKKMLLINNTIEFYKNKMELIEALCIMTELEFKNDDSNFKNIWDNLWKIVLKKVQDLSFETKYENINKLLKDLEPI